MTFVAKLKLLSFTCVKSLVMLWSSHILTRAALGSQVTFRWLRDLELVRPLSNIRTNKRSEQRGEAIARFQREDCCAVLNFNRVKFPVKFRSKAKADSFRLIGCRDQTRDSCRPKLCQNASEGMGKMPHKQTANAKHMSRARACQMKSPYENIARVSCDKYFRGHF